MNAFGVIGPSDILRTGGAVFLITRKHWLAKLLGYGWLLGEIYSLASREGALHPGPGNMGAALATRSTGTGEGLLPFTGNLSRRRRSTPLPPQSGDGLAKPKFAGFLGYAL